jgi:hypothetical protein
VDALACEDILTRQANHRHNCNIARRLNRSWPAGPNRICEFRDHPATGRISPRRFCSFRSGSKRPGSCLAPYFGQFPALALMIDPQSEQYFSLAPFDIGIDIQFTPPRCGARPHDPVAPRLERTQGAPAGACQVTTDARDSDAKCTIIPLQEGITMGMEPCGGIIVGMEPYDKAFG